MVKARWPESAPAVVKDLLRVARAPVTVEGLEALETDALAGHVPTRAAGESVWDACTARLLPRLLAGRTRGPMFVTHRRSGPGKMLPARDVCPDIGLACLSYGQARPALRGDAACLG
jgi:hypothetical protein